MTVYYLDFEDYSYFHSDRLDVINTKYKGNTGKNFAFIGNNADITMYSHIQMVYSWNKQNFDLNNVPKIKFQDVLNRNVNLKSDDFLEISCDLWWALKDRKWIEGLNIIVGNCFESWVTGLHQFEAWNLHEAIDYTVLDDTHLANRFLYVFDNYDKNCEKLYPHIEWVPTHAFLQEAVDVMQVKKEHNHWMKRNCTWFDNSNSYIDKIRDNILNREKEYKYTCLLGGMKEHRINFLEKLQKHRLDKDGILGTYDIGWDLRPKGEDKMTSDRWTLEEWISNSKLWISMETWGIKIKDNKKFIPSSSITEKTYKPMIFGMPFVVNGGEYVLSSLKEMGFENFVDIFGDYHNMDHYAFTNSNIIEIIKDIDNIYENNKNKIVDACIHNFSHLKSFEKEWWANGINDVLKRTH